MTECTGFTWNENTSDRGQCTYCDEENVLVKPDPFGQQPACQQCWEQIAWGEGED